ncbi:MAG: hypothetical protein GC150_05315 [Rhizobiales bacterium]|nr:hypothetical protein [Hyphomicrobiales bacterium]
MSILIVALVVVLLVVVLTAGRTRRVREPRAEDEKTPDRTASQPDGTVVPGEPLDGNGAVANGGGVGFEVGNGAPAVARPVAARPGPRRERQIDEIQIPGDGDEAPGKPDEVPSPGEPDEQPLPARTKAQHAETALERAERLGDSPTLARLLIEQGEEYLAGGQLVPARDALQRALVVCHALRDPELEALARLNLGDLAERDGDLTSACEHWQLARRLFSGAGRPDAERIADARMRRVQCPTDWVLDDF